MEILFKCEFGSKLYGTDTPQSDSDYKGIFLPDLKDLLLQRVKRTISTTTKPAGQLKNTQSDIDSEFFSLHYFLQLACEGDTAAIDMLHCPTNKTLQSSDAWRFIQKYRSKFYTKTMDAFVGYARSQAGKYGCKGSRLNSAKVAMDFLLGLPQDGVLKDYWEKLPVDSEFLSKYDYDAVTTQQDKRVWEVCNRKLLATTPISKCLEVVQKFYSNYGARAIMASNNAGIDFKALSHAFRAGYQCLEIFETGDLRYPLAQADFLRAVKVGKLHFVDDGLGTKLDNLIDQVTGAAAKSNLPEKVDRAFWDEFILQCYDGRTI